MSRFFFERAVTATTLIGAAAARRELPRLLIEQAGDLGADSAKPRNSHLERLSHSEEPDE